MSNNRNFNKPLPLNQIPLNESTIIIPNNETFEINERRQRTNIDSGNYIRHSNELTQSTTKSKPNKE